MSKKISVQQNSTNQQIPNKGTPGVNKQYAQVHGNRGAQLNPKRSGKKA